MFLQKAAVKARENVILSRQEAANVQRAHSVDCLLGNCAYLGLPSAGPG